MYAGLEIHPDFKAILSTNPEALAEAKKAAGYNGIALIGSSVVLAGSVMLLMDTLQQKEDVEQGDASTSDEVDMTPLYVMIGGTLISIVANNKFKTHWDNALNLYNQKSEPSNSRSNGQFTVFDKLAMNIGFSPDIQKNQWRITNTLSYSF